MPKVNKRYCYHQGFTLIEVLIASVILFMFLALASQAFYQSAQSSIKAERAVKMAALVPLVVENIRQQIVVAKSSDDQNGDGLLFELAYQWQATLIKRSSPAERFDPDEGEFKQYLPRYNLWQVQVTVNEGDFQRSWRYEEISWHKSI